MGWPFRTTNAARNCCPGAPSHETSSCPLRISARSPSAGLYPDRSHWKVCAARTPAHRSRTENFVMGPTISVERTRSVAAFTRRMIRLTLLALVPILAVAADPVPGLNPFSSTLYERLAKGNDKNLILSPYNTSAALSMALAGARGPTASEISRLLGADAPSYHADLASLADRIRKDANTADNTFLDANRVWLQRDFPVLPDFRRILETTYPAPFGPAHFAHDLEAAPPENNTWTPQQNKDPIPDLFAPRAITPNPRL